MTRSETEGHRGENMIKRYFAVFCYILSLTFFLSCATVQEKADPKASLEKLAQQYWTKRLVEGDFRYTYNLEMEKDEGALSFEAYSEKLKKVGRCVSVETKEVTITGDRGEVFMSVGCNIPTKGYKQTLQDLWLYTSGGWKHKYFPIK